MTYVTTKPNIGEWVILTEQKNSLAGSFLKGSRVRITEVDPMRGYTFEDEEGNRIIEAGFGGFSK